MSMQKINNHLDITIRDCKSIQVETPEAQSTTDKVEKLLIDSAPIGTTDSDLLPLPEELQVMVLHQLDLPQLITLSTVSRSGKRIASDESVLRDMAHQIGCSLDPRSSNSSLQQQQNFVRDLRQKALNISDRPADITEILKKPIPTIAEIILLQKWLDSMSSILSYNKVAEAIGVEPLNNSGLNSSEVIELAKLVPSLFRENQVAISQITHLSLKGLQLTSLPKEMEYLNQLEELDLDENQFTAFPKEILNLTQIQKLYLGKNQLTKFPPEITQFTQLKKLSLAVNKIDSIPSEIENLRQLKYLNLNKNQIGSVAREIRTLNELRKFELYDNPVREFPREMAGLTQMSLFLHLIGTADLSDLKYY